MEYHKKKLDLYFTDFKKANLSQLLQILRHEDCEVLAKCAAESELERRAASCGMPIKFNIWYAKLYG